MCMLLGMSKQLGYAFPGFYIKETICYNRKQGTAYHASTIPSGSAALPATSPVVPLLAPTALANLHTLTP